MDNIKKTDMEFKIHPIIMFWVLLFFVSIFVFSITPFQDLLSNYNIEDKYYRCFYALIISFVAVLLGKNKLHKIGLSSGEEIQFNEALTFNVKIFQTFSIAFDRMCRVLLSFFKEKLFGDTFKLFLKLGFFISWTFGSLDNYFFYMVNGFLLAFIFSAILSNILLIIFNLTYYYYEYIELEKDYLQTKKINNNYNEVKNNGKNFYDLIINHIIPLLQKNDFKRILTYLKDNDIPSFLVSISVMAYSYILLILFYNGDGDYFFKKNYQKIKSNSILKIYMLILDIWGKINPIVWICKMFSSKVILTIIHPFLKLILFIIEIFKVILNTIFIVGIILYSLWMNILQPIIFIYFFYNYISGFIQSINLSYSWLYNFTVIISLLISILIFVMILYSFFVSLRNTYSIKVNYKEIKFLLYGIYNNIRPKFKMNIYLVVALLISVVINLKLINNDNIWENISNIKSQVDKQTILYRGELKETFSSLDTFIEKINKKNKEVLKRKKMEEMINE